MLELVRAFTYVFVPRVCKGCGRVLMRTEEHLCMVCVDALPWTGFEHQEDNPPRRMFALYEEVAFVWSALHFHATELVPALIHAIKYGRAGRAARWLGTLMGERLRQASVPSLREVEVFVPVPLHWRRQAERGYNQAQLIAEGLSKSTCIPCVADALIRHRYTRTQTQLTAHQRQQNLQNAFLLKKPNVVRGRCVALVDDVLTTGATLLACLEALKATAPRSVIFITAAWAGEAF